MENLINEILKLKTRKNAVILAHNYQPPEIQDIADFTGDSLGLSRKAAATDAALIVFCGVHFMAETAKIICPGKKVVLPDPSAGCPMADMITAEQLREFKAKYPGCPVVCYVNSTAEVKAESDVCCTSSNAVKVVLSLPRDKTVLFVPDKFLGAWVKKQTGYPIVCWNGFCPTHVRMTREMLDNARARHPVAEVLVHPECPPEVCEAADQVLSTGQMLEFVRKSTKTEFIIGTEKGLLHQLEKQNPGKAFYLVTKDLICPNMKKITLEKLLSAMKEEKVEITVSPAVADRARRAIEKMLVL
jgi:quinolinate synthase